MVLGIQEVRKKLGNQLYAFLAEGFIRLHEDYPKLASMRRSVLQDKKETAKFTKKLLAESLKKQGSSIEEFKAMYESCKKNQPIYMGLVNLEKQGFKILKPQVEKFPIFIYWLAKVKGINVRLAAQVICAIKDIRRFPNPSKLRTYLGTAPALKKQRGVKAVFNPKYKGLMLGKVADCFIKSESQYKIVYDDKKLKKQTENPEWTKMKCHNYARKAMINRFVVELWVAWYRSLGLEPPCNPYIVEQPSHNLKPMIVPYEPRKC